MVTWTWVDIGSGNDLSPLRDNCIHTRQFFGNYSGSVQEIWIWKLIIQDHNRHNLGKFHVSEVYVIYCNLNNSKVIIMAIWWMTSLNASNNTCAFHFILKNWNFEIGNTLENYLFSCNKHAYKQVRVTTQNVLLPIHFQCCLSISYSRPPRFAEI